MDQTERDREAAQVADFRYSLIAECANPYLNREQRRRLLFEKARLEYEVPRLGRRKLTVGCLRKWLSLYQRYGRDGLYPHSRSDSGSPRSLSAEEAALFLNTLESQPELSASVALRLLQKEGKIHSAPSSSSLSRLVRQAGLERKRRCQQKASEQNLKFEFESPLECVQADGLYSVAVPDEKGKRRQAILLSFLDDATRRVLFAGFGFSENSQLFERGIKHVLLAHGRIGRLYCDHGSAFVSGQTQRILSILGIPLIHSQVGRPQGRGKIERYHRTVREQFLRPLDVESLKSLQDLEIRFRSWLESEYHRSPHRGPSGKTPLEVWVERAGRIIPIDPTLDYDAIFRYEVSRKVHKDSTVTLDGVLYEVSSLLIGERIILSYDLFTPPERRTLWVRHEGRECGSARKVDSYSNARVRRGALRQDAVVESCDGPSSTAAPESRSSVDAGLSASRIRFEVGEEAEEESR